MIASTAQPSPVLVPRWVGLDEGDGELSNTTGNRRGTASQKSYQHPLAPDFRHPLSHREKVRLRLATEKASFGQHIEEKTAPATVVSPAAFVSL